ncbi:60S ribosomal protein L34-like [Dromiciops gliroides]|uniref:60S ribosomal protein L34-like n=1 Tax=Dromiciops gliroides TaxID=33562 RepID=UPI001CC507B3|nr:60S ribosomal protein L34-like [Dromiciops gliroides]
MVEHLTYCHRSSYDTVSKILSCHEPLVTELFTIIPGKLEKHQSQPVVCVQEDFKVFVQGDLKFFMGLSKTKKHVSRADGGSMCAKCVRDRVKRAFLTEKQKMVVKVLEAQVQSQKSK